MKIRMKGNSVRIRLSRPEIELFGEKGVLEEKTQFGSRTFTYVLRSHLDIYLLCASYRNDTVIVYVPDAMATEWTTTDRVGFEYEMDNLDGSYLHILIEKDFKCVDNTTEDQSDNYDHPSGNC